MGFALVLRLIGEPSMSASLDSCLVRPIVDFRKFLRTWQEKSDISNSSTNPGGELFKNWISDVFLEEHCVGASDISYIRYLL